MLQHHQPFPSVHGIKLAWHGMGMGMGGQAVSQCDAFFIYIPIINR